MESYTRNYPTVEAATKGLKIKKKKGGKEKGKHFSFPASKRAKTMFFRRKHVSETALILEMRGTCILTLSLRTMYVIENRELMSKIIVYQISTIYSRFIFILKKNRSVLVSDRASSVDPSIVNSHLDDFEINY